MEQRVGTCSLCGGDVIGTRGAYWSVIPPAPDTCSRCGAVARGQSDVIEMVPGPRREFKTTTTQNTGEVLWGGYPLTWGDEG